MLANLCALHLDLRLDALAASIGGQYTRYADDLAISGGEALRRRCAGIADLVAGIAAEEGFAVNHRKTRIMHRSRRQVLAGVVVNEKPNVRRIAHVGSLNPARAAKLSALFGRIDWSR